jgi:hypothetical protein
MFIRSQFAFVLAVVGLVWPPAGDCTQNPQVQAQARASEPPGLAAALAQVPPDQAIVTYRIGELTIKARNAPLADVLRAVSSQTGATIDIPSGAGADERILAILGPGPAKEVLASLLKYSQFDYAMRGSASDPNALARVILFPKTKDPNVQNQVTQPRVNSTPVTSNGANVPQPQQMQRPTQAQADTPRAYPVPRQRFLIRLRHRRR